MRRVHPPEIKTKVGLQALGGLKTINPIAQSWWWLGQARCSIA
jgi:hypothetical protein